MHQLEQPPYKVVLVVSFCVSRRSIPHKQFPSLTEVVSQSIAFQVFPAIEALG
jgi:hypothetical protein